MFGRSETRKLREEKARLQAELEETKATARRLRRIVKNLRADPFDAERIVWIFATSRSGTTWLASMLAEPDGNALWREPLVGELFGHHYYVRASEQHHRGDHFILGRHRQTWLGSIRRFVLDGAAAVFPDPPSGYLIVKEPNGSIGAPLLMEALPESCMVVLVRDPRDVVASALDANSPTSWRAKKGRAALVGQPPDVIVHTRAEIYARYVGNSLAAYRSHGGPKALIRYEDLLADTLGELRRLHQELGIAVDKEELARSVEKHSWENIPEEKKGEGMFYRKASPGSWREDLTPDQARVVEEITRPILEQFYPNS